MIFDPKLWAGKTLFELRQNRIISHITKNSDNNSLRDVNCTEHRDNDQEKMPEQMTITDEELDDMLHTLGNSNTPGDLGWRNYYVTGADETHLDHLVEFGLMELTRGTNSGGGCYRVTEKGIEYLRSLGYKVELR